MNNNQQLDDILNEFIEEEKTSNNVENKLNEIDSILKNTHIQPQFNLSQRGVKKVECILAEKSIKGRMHYLIKWETNEEEEQEEEESVSWLPIEDISRYTLQLYHLNKEATNFNKLIIAPQHFAYLYLRTSKPRVNDGQVSIEVQKNDMMQYCKANNIAIRGITIDEGTSAKNMKNLEGLNIILETIETDDILMVWDVSRFSRNSLQALHLLEELTLRNIYTYFIRENLSYEGAMAKHHIRQALSEAQLKSENTSERVKAAIQYKKSLGNYIGQAKYGYTITNIDGIRTLVKCNVEQQNIGLVNKLCNQYQKTYNLSRLRPSHYDEIAYKLNKSGLRFRGKLFTRSNVSLCFKRSK
jgi:DNA invertase Pin-like site-specific DNA recombinase